MLKTFITLLFSWLLSFNAAAIDFFNQPSADELLPAEQAFQVNATATEQSIFADWQIADGYYLYKHQFKAVSSSQLGDIALPEGLKKHDEIFGEIEAFYNFVSAEIPVLEHNGTVEVTLHFQGCADIGVCYPPMQQTFSFNLEPNANQETAPVVTSSPNNENNLAADLAERPLWALLVFFGLGVLLSFNPCSYPMFPILSRIIVGHGENITRAKGVSLSLAYIIPMAITYALAGIAVAAIGQNFFAAFQNPWVLSALCIILLILALSMFGFYEIQMPAKWQSKLNAINDKQKSGNYLGAAIMGALSALIVGACVLPPLTGALLYIANTGNLVIGGTAMFMFGLGMGVPLLFIGFSAGWLLPKAGGWMEKIKGVFGLFLLAAILLILERFVNDSWIMLGWAALFILSGLYLGALKGFAGISLAEKAVRLLAIAATVYGLIIAIGWAQGERNPWQPLQLNKHQTSSHEAPFKQIKTVSDLQQALANAKGSPVMLDFYADWCIPCKIMEKEIFADTEVQQKLSATIWLQADVTADDAEDKALKAYLNVINPPSVLFFDRTGNEVKSHRITGKLNKQQFIDITSNLP